MNVPSLRVKRDIRPLTSLTALTKPPAAMGGRRQHGGSEMETQTTMVPMKQAMKVVNLLKADMSGRKQGYQYMKRVNEGLRETLEEIDAQLEKGNVDRA